MTRPRSRPLTSTDLTDDVVRSTFVELNDRYRDAQYLCRAYLQFGPETMSAYDLARLCLCVEKARGTGEARGGSRGTAEHRKTTQHRKTTERRSTGREQRVPGPDRRRRPAE
jgi:hypothetical protein